MRFTNTTYMYANSYLQIIEEEICSVRNMLAIYIAVLS